jgi:hypothetical protein
MKTMKTIKLLAAIAASVALTVSCTTEREQMDKHHFDNKLYIITQNATDEILVKPTSTGETRTLSVGTALKVDQTVSAEFEAAPELLETYKETYYDPDVFALPDSMCTIENGKVTINEGSNTSSEATINFTGITDLSRDSVYVMPIALRNVQGMDVLESKTTVYYIFKGAALINVVCNIAENRAGAQSWKTPEKFSGMTQFTLEALIRPTQFGRLISTVMGVEGHFLLRIGDAGVPDNQLQIASSSNLTSSALQLETGKWTHIACVFDNGNVSVYYNGSLKLTGYCGRSSVTFSAYGSDKGENSGRYFWIGYSYTDDRYFDGDISEVRIWNKCLTQEEIMAPGHFYSVDPTSDGLAAYWKCDEGAGQTLTDYANGNDLTLDNACKWPKVNLPE